MNKKSSKLAQESSPTIKTLRNKEYIIKSVFLGGGDVKSVILKLAERKTIREMGLDIPIEIDST